MFIPVPPAPWCLHPEPFLLPEAAGLGCCGVSETCRFLWTRAGKGHKCLCYSSTLGHSFSVGPTGKPPSSSQPPAVAFSCGTPMCSSLLLILGRDWFCRCELRLFVLSVH